jgi:hypothetical protein
MKTVWVYNDASKRVGDPHHVLVFADRDGLIGQIDPLSDDTFATLPAWAKIVGASFKYVR